MPRNCRIYERNQSHFVTFRAEEGLPLPPNPLINRILKSVLCRAQTLYPVEVCAFKFMANHAHMVITVLDPEVVDDFMRHVKKESSHAINRLRGIRKKTVWCAGYDAPRLLDVEVTIGKIVYTYTNAQESNLVETIEEYPGFSSWNQFVSGEHILKLKRSCSRRETKPGQARGPKGYAACKYLPPLNTTGEEPYETWSVLA